MRGKDDHLLETPMPALLREVTGIDPDRSGSHAMLKAAGVRSTQRLALGDVGGGIVALTWPAELVAQAHYLYDGERAPRLLDAAAAGQWEVHLRPHLAFWRSTPGERLYTTPAEEMTPDTYVKRWTVVDRKKIGSHDLDTIRTELWPWLLERGYAMAATDRDLLEPFLERLAKRRRAAHLRPGLCLIRRWNADTLADLRTQKKLAAEVRSAVNCLLSAVGDPLLPAP